MNYDFYFHDVARESNFNNLTLKTYQKATKILKYSRGKKKREVQDCFGLLITLLSASLFCVSSL